MKLQSPKPGTQFCLHDSRLALFHRATDHLDYWREYWGSPDELLARGRLGSLGEFDVLVTEHVPRYLPVLEAGCGPAHLVAALQARGYKSIGIDYEPKIVEHVNRVAPELDVRLGDVLALPFEDGSLGAYLSLGVVEHFVGGPLPALREARRVLHRQGVALVSVPDLNPLRKLHAQTVTNNTGGLNFHQYYYARDEFAEHLRQAGLRVIARHGYAVEAFLCREHPFISGFWKSAVAREPLKRPLRRFLLRAPGWMRERYAHMMLYVCVRSDVEIEGGRP